nr:putative RNA-dependent RNA polymerase [Rhizoctonia solani mitovirus 64]
MIITLIAMTAFLSLLHYTGTEHWLVYLVNQPIEYHLCAIVILVVLKLGKSFYSAYPTLAGLYRSAMRVIARMENVTSRLEKSNTDDSPFKNGGKRRFSSSGSSSSINTKSPFGNSVPGRGGNPVGKSFEGPSYHNVSGIKNSFSYDKKVMDRFFRTIAKEGTLVSLDTMVKVFSAKLQKTILVKTKLPLLSNLFEKIGFRIFGAVFPGKGKFSSRMRQLHAFLVHLNNLRRHHGSPYVVKYLKASQLAIQKAIAGTKVSSLNQIDSSLPFPYLSTCGLPRFIPIRDRRLMLVNGSSSVIRWWLTLYSVYRVINIPSQLKLETITAPLTVPVNAVLEVAREIIQIINVSMFDTSVLNQARFLFLESASAGSRISWMGLLFDVLGLKNEPEVFRALLDYADITGNYRISAILRYIDEQLSLLDNQMAITGYLFKALQKSLPIGKLSTKKEAAGKVRVFAMVDVWTQSLLKPLHDMLFKFLKSLPNDATFDQNASVKRCMVKSQLTGKSFGYDLSAATDRLPIDLQVAILNKIRPGIGEAWKTILVSRGYSAEFKEFNVSDTLKYSVGQPMGALSSWAMLAIVHHYVAQFAAITAANIQGTLSGPFWIKSSVDFQVFNMDTPWYTGYEVLGDDIVFFEDHVAKEYLKIMDTLGVPINLMKSVVATNPTFEFAKVTGHKGHNVAAVSWASFMAQPSIMGRAGIAYSMLTKGIVHSHVMKWLDTFARQSRYTQGSPNTFYLALGTMLSRKGYMPFFEFLYTLMQKTAGMFNVYQTLLEKANIDTVKQAISNIAKTWEPVVVPNPISRRRGWKTDEFALKQTIISTIGLFLGGGVYPDGRKVYGVNPHLDAIRLAYNILTAPSMFLTLSPESRIAPMIHKGVFKLDSRVLRNLNPLEAFIHHLFCFFFVQIYDKLIMLHADIIEQGLDDLHGKTIDQLMDIVDLIDRYVEVTKLYDRAVGKLSLGMDKDRQARIAERNLVESPLAVLQMLLEADEPFGATTGENPGLVSWGHFATEYMYALERLENLPLQSPTKAIGEIDPHSFYLGSYGPLR